MEEGRAFVKTSLIEELPHLDATAQAELVAREDCAPDALVVAACERIRRLDSELGALAVYYGDEALKEAATLSPKGRFRGVPFLMKDVGARQIGQPYYAGNRALRDVDHRADSDTTLGTRFRKLGLVTLGNSNSPEFGLQSNTWPLSHGPTRNPWNLAHSAGGSSGGACAAVAAGLVPVAHASDGAGSIRIPAAWCGLIGLKPSRDLIHWRYSGHDRSDVEFVVARSLRDTALFLDLLRPRASRLEVPGFHLESLARRPERLRIGYCTRSPAGGKVHPACIRAVDESVEALRILGHRVEEATPTTFFEYEERSLYGAAFGFHEYQSCLEDLERRLGRSIGPDDVEPFLWELAQMGAQPLSAGDTDGAIAWLSGWQARTLAFFETHDVLITPTVCEPAPLLDSMNPSKNTPIELLEKMLPHMAFTEYWNATGQPAISLPIGWSQEDALPVGVQLIAAPGRDDLLLSLAANLMAGATAMPSRPPFHA